ncbi:MAG: penicillin-binding protein 2 [Chloroflexi bacterium]|nr:penicillin-binding protein 2 [Anaerolineaceae bacterium]NMB88077.1 penicillin-binding protein 2 [Chloroflexota bacterium]
MTHGFLTRYNILGVAFSLLGLLIVVQMARIQNSSSGRALEEQARQEYEYSRVTVQPERGNIYDRWGNLLAGNKEVYEVGINLYQVQTNGSAQTIASALSSVLGLDYNEVLTQATTPYQREYDYVVLTDFVDPEAIGQLQKLKDEYQDNLENLKLGKNEVAPSLVGLSWNPHLMRSYPEGSVGANIVGFYKTRDRQDGAGHLGVEEKYNDLLAGTPLELNVPVDPNKIEEVPKIPPGASLILTIDRDIQSMAERVIDNAVTANGAESGTMVILDPKTGEILAMATTPRMDPNRYWDYQEPYFDRAIDLTYEPGSVFKVLTMAAALDAGAVTPDTPFLDTGSINVGGLSIYNWDRGAWGPQDMVGCMQHSLNVCLAWVATQLGPSDFYAYLQKFGIGHRTNVDLAGEITWPLSIPGDETWSEANLGTNSFGQGVAATPLQMAAAISAVANDGKIMSPHVLKAIIEDGRQRDTTPMVIGTPITAETAHTLTDMLAVSLEEEASTALVPGYRVAGKTGTAEIPGPDGYTSSLTNASFVGWGPADDPQFVVYIWLEEPTSAPWGSVVAAPVFSETVTELVNLMKIPPDDIRTQLLTH